MADQPNILIIWGDDIGLSAGMTPVRNQKNSTWEGAYRVPAMVRWPVLARLEAGIASS